ncbi:MULTISPECIES: FMN reductase [unclassified Pseudomonas]|uniref:FMN reductase n=1 Tax=unclassified Pseudomonas TaxID=196821 RepID=UPI0008718262|nr:MULTISPECIES: FMN reductase [unclassified Pseudomonas]MBD9462934.1 FMN reductase [Pseudomonas sp. Pdm06]SCW30307.1 FMN reductase [Pseudomonas sp. NFACC56-3]SFK12180.1 FMN reductase [Pseudomonas sp. NFACC52]
MSKQFKVVAVSGSVQHPSRTLALLQALVDRLGQQLPIEVRLIELAKVGPQFAGVLRREALPAAVQEDLHAIESADLLIAASPVYRASYTGLFKHLFDFVHHEALKNVPVLLAATGGSDRHALMIDHQLRPLFGFFQALSLPVGVYASETDFSQYRISSAQVLERIERAVESALLSLVPGARRDASAA